MSADNMDLDAPARYFREVTRAAHEQAAKTAIEEALVATRGNISDAAAQLQMSRSHVMRLLKQFALTEFAAELRLAAGHGSRVERGHLKGRVLGAKRTKVGKPRSV